MTWSKMVMGELNGGEGSVGESGLGGWVGKCLRVLVKDLRRAETTLRISSCDRSELFKRT